MTFNSNTKLKTLEFENSIDKYLNQKIFCNRENITNKKEWENLYNFAVEKFGLLNDSNCKEIFVNYIEFLNDKCISINHQVGLAYFQSKESKKYELWLTNISCATVKALQIFNLVLQPAITEMKI